jgi:hypothetical protein
MANKMQKSESIKELATALSKAQGEMESAKKDTNNPFFKSKYADLASVVAASKEPLTKNGLSIAQVVDINDVGEMILTTILLHSSGEFISGNYPIRPVIPPIKKETDVFMAQDSTPTPQSIGSALMYARRYAYSSIIGLSSDDDDGNIASGNKAPTSTAPKELPSYSSEKFNLNKKIWATLISENKKTPEEIIAAIRTSAMLSVEQMDAIRALEVSK